MNTLAAPEKSRLGRRILSRDGSRSAFWRCECGQDLVEYALLLAFVSLAGVAMFLSMGGLTSALWGTVNSRLAASNQGS